METVIDDIAEKESEKLKKDSAKEVDNGNQDQDNVNETENKNPREEVGEVASVVEHHDSLSAVLDPEKGLVDPTMGSLVEQTDVISQESLAISKNGVDSAKDGGDTPAVHDKTTSEPDSRPTEDHVKEPIEPEAEIQMEVEKASEEPDSKISGDHNNVRVMPDNETAKENGTVNSAGHVRGLTDHHQETTMDCDKGPEIPGSESVLSQGNEPSMPDMETSINPGNIPDLPVSDTLKDIDKKIDVLVAETPKDHEQGLSAMPATETSSEHEKGIIAQEAEPRKDIKDEFLDTEVVVDASIDSIICNDVSVDPATEAGKKDNPGAHGENGDIEDASMKYDTLVSTIPCDVSSAVKSEEGGEGDLNNGVHKINSAPPTCDGTMNSKNSFLLDDMSEGNESGTEEEQSAFTKELEIFFRARNMEFKPPKFYGEGLNCLKLWRAVIRLGGYDKVTGCKLWRQVGESFRPPKTCTTVSWTFRGFYEKALLEYERHKVNGGELQIPLVSISEPMNIDNQASGSGRARRDAAARAMQGWHSQRLLGNGEDKSSVPQQKRDKQIGTPGLLKRKRPVSADHGAKSAHIQVSKPLLDVTVVDVGPPAEWVKINVQRTKDCFEVYALVPGLLREEVRVQSDPAGRLVISGEPENPDNLWGATPFKKVVSLPARIDPHHTSAVVTLNGQLFVRVPLEQSD